MRRQWRDFAFYLLVQRQESGAAVSRPERWAIPLVRRSLERRLRDDVLHPDNLSAKASSYNKLIECLILELAATRGNITLVINSGTLQIQWSMINVRKTKRVIRMSKYIDEWHIKLLQIVGIMWKIMILFTFLPFIIRDKRVVYIITLMRNWNFFSFNENFNKTEKFF